MHQNKFSFEVLYAMIVRILLSTYWDLLWRIKTNYKTSIICNGCKNTIFWMLENCVMHQKKSFQVLFAVIARVLFWIFCDESKHILFGSDVCSKITRLLFSTWCGVISASHIPCYTFIIVTSVSDAIQSQYFFMIYCLYTGQQSTQGNSRDSRQLTAWYPQSVLFYD